LYKLPHNEQANFTLKLKRKEEEEEIYLIFIFYILINIPEFASSGSGTRRYRAGSTETL
jgi:hypothetical protein